MSCCDEYCANHGCNQGRDCPVRIERIRQAKQRLEDKVSIPWWPIIVSAAVSAIVVNLYYLFK